MGSANTHHAVNRDRIGMTGRWASLLEAAVRLAHNTDRDDGPEQSKQAPTCENPPAQTPLLFAGGLLGGLLILMSLRSNLGGGHDLRRGRGGRLGGGIVGIIGAEAIARGSRAARRGGG